MYRRHRPEEIRGFSHAPLGYVEQPSGATSTQAVLAAYPAATGGAKPLTWTWWPRSIDTTAKVSPYLSVQDTAIVALGVLSTLDAESGGRVDAVGDAGHSIGLFQMHDLGAGHGMTIKQRENPDVQFKHAEELVRSFEAALYWARIEGRAYTPSTVALAAKRVQKCQDGFEIGYAKAWTRLQAEAGWTLP